MLHGSTSNMCIILRYRYCKSFCDNPLYSSRFFSFSFQSFQVLDIQPSTRYAGGNLLATKLRRVEAAWLTKRVGKLKLIALENCSGFAPINSCTRSSELAKDIPNHGNVQKCGKCKELTPRSFSCCETCRVLSAVWTLRRNTMIQESPASKALQSPGNGPGKRNSIKENII